MKAVRRINPFRAPEPLPILNPSSFVPKNGFPVVKGLRTVKEGSGACPVSHKIFVSKKKKKYTSVVLRHANSLA